jgi:hypothetical protein
MILGGVIGKFIYKFSCCLLMVVGKIIRSFDSKTVTQDDKAIYVVGCGKDQMQCRDDIY